ncbi:MAG: hypothetical protein KY475_23385, partial [Planctomycetes bacterium]|nr:hypothetical protein [Planctomycetota bacterium]
CDAPNAAGILADDSRAGLTFGACGADSPEALQRGRSTMTDSLHPREIRTLVLSTFRQLGAASFAESDFDETLLVRDGRCTARSYRVDDFFAMWLIEVGLLQFYDAEGDMVLLINLLEEASPQKLAA